MKEGSDIAIVLNIYLDFASNDKSQSSLRKAISWFSSEKINNKFRVTET